MINWVESFVASVIIIPSLRDFCINDLGGCQAELVEALLTDMQIRFT